MGPAQTKEHEERNEAADTIGSIEDGWSDLGEDLPQELDTLPSIIHKFIRIATTTPEYVNNTTYVHASLANIYAIATALQSSITPNTLPLKRNITLRDLAQRLHLWPTDIIVQLQRDASHSITLLDKYIRDTLKNKMDFIEKCHAKESLKHTRLSTQIGGYHGAGEELPMESLRNLATLRYQACLVLERLERIIRMQVEKDVLEGEQNLELKDIYDMLPEINKVVEKIPIKIECGSGLCRDRMNAFKAVEEYRHAINVVSEELLQLLNDHQAEEDSHDGHLSALGQGFAKMYDTQVSFEALRSQLDALLAVGQRKTNQLK
jgi:hypothetical protein